jgi:hypothetical protein
VIAVGQVRRRDGGEPAVAADLVAGDLCDRVSDVIVVADRIERLSLCPGPPTCGEAHLQQRWIEDRLLRRRVQVQERAQPGPHRRQGGGVRAPDLLQDREQPALLVVVVKDQLGDVHGPSLALSHGHWDARQKPDTAPSVPLPVMLPRPGPSRAGSPRRGNSIT